MSTTTARAGVVMALGSAAAFGSSGPMAKALLDTGWTAAAVVAVRLGGAAVILTIAAAVALRGRWRPRPEALRTVVVYGVVAMAGVQLAFFNAVRTLDVGVALMIEYLAPLLLLGWTSLRRRALPPPPTLLGAALALAGLALVLDLTGSGSLDPAGVAWALLAAVCLGAFFVISDQHHADLPPLVMAAGGTAVGAVVVVLAGVSGLVPLAFTTSAPVLAGASVGWLVPAAWLAVVSTVVAYLTGIGGIIRLGTRSASFVALTEVLFAVVVAWALLAELPAPVQLLGGAGIVAGIVLIRREERTRRPGPATPEIPLEPIEPLPRVPVVSMSDLSPRAKNVRVLQGRHVRIEFDNGTVATIDLEPLLRGPVFAQIASDDAAFARVQVSPEWGCLEWPGGPDLDPDVLYEIAVAGGRASTAT